MLSHWSTFVMLGQFMNSMIPSYNLGTAPNVQNCPGFADCDAHPPPAGTYLRRRRERACTHNAAAI